MLTTNRADNFNDITGVPAHWRDIIRRDHIPQTSAFRAVEGRQYAVDTATAAFSAYLPKAPHHGALVAFRDITGNWGTNSLTLDARPNTISLSGATAAQTLALSTDYALVLCMWDATGDVWDAMQLGPAPRTINRVSFFL